MQPLQNCTGPTIRIGREILCLPYAGFFKLFYYDSNLMACILQELVKARNTGSGAFKATIFWRRG